MEKPKKFPQQQQSLPGIEADMNPQPQIISKNYVGSGKLKDKIALVTAVLDKVLQCILLEKELMSR